MGQQHVQQQRLSGQAHVPISQPQPQHHVQQHAQLAQHAQHVQLQPQQHNQQQRGSLPSQTQAQMQQQLAQAKQRQQNERLQQVQALAQTGAIVGGLGGAHNHPNYNNNAMPQAGYNMLPQGHQQGGMRTGNPGMDLRQFHVSHLGQGAGNAPVVRASGNSLNGGTNPGHTNPSRGGGGAGGGYPDQSMRASVVLRD